MLPLLKKLYINHRRLAPILFFALISVTCFAQNGVIRGQVTDATNAAPVEFANVYFNNSLTGTVTDTTGHYILKNIDPGSYQLIISFVGYEPYRKSVIIGVNDTLNINVILKASVKQLSEVVVKSKVDAKWKRQLHKFENYLFGPNVDNKDCEIINPGYLTFNDNPKTDSFTAECKVPLQIINHKLGYKIYFTLRQFCIYKGALTYYGDTRFEALRAETSKDLIAWETNRNDAYRGSLRDFFKCMINNTLQQNSFLAYQVLPSASYVNSHLYKDKLGKELIPLDLEKMVIKNNREGDYFITSRLPIEIIYTGRYTKDSPYPDMPYEVSRIALNTGRIELNANGFVYDPTSFTVTGNRAGERLGDMLPREYHPPVPSVNSNMPDLNTLYSKLLDSLSRQVGGLGPWQNQETVFLTTDKPYYIAGDEMWFSVNLLDDFSRKPLYGDRAVYVELVSPQDSVIEHQAVYVTDGNASGKMQIPENITEGCYMLRGYTDWMRNFSEAGYSGKTVLIHSGINQAGLERESSSPADTVILQFYPEGGRLVNSIHSVVGIKATDRKGEGVLINGSLVDERGRFVETVQTNSMGIGKIIFKPENKRKYFVKINHVNLRNINITYPLPVAEESGYVLEALTGDKNLLTIHITATRDLKDHGLILLAQSGGKIFYREAFYLESTEKTLWLNKSGFPEGTLQLTLFDLNGNEESRRLVFIDHSNDQPHISITTGKSAYNPDEPVSMKIRIENDTHQPVSASMSVSITANDIFNSSAYADPTPEIMLQSGFFEPIQDPAYYFRDTTVATRNDLDNLMLTLTHYRYDWKTMSSLSDLRYGKEGGMLVKGKATSNHNPCEDCQVSLFPISHTLDNLSFVTDEDGSFTVPVPGRFDSADYLIVIKNRKNKIINGKINLEGYSPFKFNNQFRNCSASINQKQIENYDSVYQSIKSDYEKLRTIMLNEVTITKTPIEKQPINTNPFKMTIPVKPDNIVDLKDSKIAFTNITEALLSTVSGFSIVKAVTPSGRVYYKFVLHGPHTLTQNEDPLFIVDGVELGDNPYDYLLTINPLDVDRIEVFKNTSAAFWGARGANGVIAIYTKRGGGDSPIDESSVRNKMLKIRGYSPEATFNTGKEDSANITIDKKITVFWAANMRTDSTGTVNLHFTNASNASYFTVHVEGITDSGIPFSYVQKTNR